MSGHAEHHGHPGGHHHQHGPQEVDEAVLAETLDLDGVVLQSSWATAFDLVRQAATEPVRRVLDLGAGSGVGTAGLARLFPDAEVVAVDVSATMLAHLQEKAQRLGLDRVRTLECDLDGEWPGPISAHESVDLVWAAKALHHLTDPDRALGRIFQATRSGGLLASVEFDEPLRFLPDDIGIGRPGLEARCLEGTSEDQAAALPELGSHWASRFAAAGLTVLGEHPLLIEESPSSPEGLRYARLWLTRLRSGAGSRLSEEDRAAFAALLDEGGLEVVARERGLQIRGTRTLTLARRP